MVYGPGNVSLAGETMHQPFYSVSITPDGDTKVSKSLRNNLAIYSDSISLIRNSKLSVVLHAILFNTNYLKINISINIYRSQGS